MKFGAVYAAIWLWIIPALFIFYILAQAARKRVVARFADANVLPKIAGSLDVRKRKFRNFMILTAVFLLVLTLMRPQWGFQWQEVKRKGVDILIALDTSNSMLAEDVLPNRLGRAKLAIKDLVLKLRTDRIGLVIFAGKAFLQCPLTLDYDGFLLSLDDVDVNSISIGGTSISSAVSTAIKSYESVKKDDKVLIIITDGEDLEGGIARAIEKARHAGIKISCVGIGLAEGELVPMRDINGKMRFLKDSRGRVVKTRLMEAPLQKIALETGGMYVRAAGVEFGLDLIYDKQLSKLQKQEFESKMEKRYNERFQIPLFFAILLLLFEPLIGDRKKEQV